MLVFRQTRNTGISIWLPSTPDNSHPYVYRGESYEVFVSSSASSPTFSYRETRSSFDVQVAEIEQRCRIVASPLFLDALSKRKAGKKAPPRSKRGAVETFDLPIRSRDRASPSLERKSSEIVETKATGSRVSRSSVVGWSLNIRYRFDRSQARAPGTTERFWSGVHSSIIRCPSLHGISLWNPFCQPQKLRYVLTSAAFRSPPTR